MVIKFLAFHNFLRKNADRKQGIEWDSWANIRAVRNEEVILCRQCLLPRIHNTMPLIYSGVN